VKVVLLGEGAGQVVLVPHRLAAVDEVAGRVEGGEQDQRVPLCDEVEVALDRRLLAGGGRHQAEEDGEEGGELR